MPEQGQHSVERKPHLISCTGSKTPAQHTQPTKGIMASILGGKTQLASTLKPVLVTKILDTAYTGMLPHKNTPSRPQQITVSPKFIETDEVQ